MIYTMILCELHETARKILDLNPDLVPKFRLMRDVLGVQPDSSEYHQAKQEMLRSKWVRQLADTQRENGIWGRFHTQDTKVKTVFPTTEFALRRALALGLDKNDPILKKAAEWMARCLQGKETWSDWVEKSEGRATMTRAITASTLARVDPLHPILETEWQHWAEIAE
jgi:hypothetical protein